MTISIRDIAFPKSKEAIKRDRRFNEERLHEYWEAEDRKRRMAEIMRVRREAFGD